MRISDWSSDVFSSDLVAAGEDAADTHLEVHLQLAHRKQRLAHAGIASSRRSRWQAFSRSLPEEAGHEEAGPNGRSAGSSEIGRAHVCTTAPNAHLVCRPLLVNKQHTPHDLPAMSLTH